ncbi:MAG: site-2 protease family protein [Victivallaceae bacterium]|jgi:putative peptide zinc metalloprotease protein
MDNIADTPAPEKKFFTGTLRTDLDLFRGEPETDGSATWIVFDPVSDKYYRLSEEDHQIISCMSENLELDAFLEKVKNCGIHADKDKIMKILSFLNQSNLMLPVYKMTEDKVEKHQAMKRRNLIHLILYTYLFFKIPLLSPDPFLDRTVNFVKTIFNKWTFLTLGVIAGCGYLCLIVRWQKLTEEFISTINFQGMVRYSIAVVIIKCVHEFAHAYTAKAVGIRVRRMGMAFIVFFPRLYTDLTDSWRIPDRHKRFLIDGSGILSEIIIGGWAALAWAYSGPGLTQAVAYYIFTVSIISTALINGNPFIRYDGYYLLMDLVGIDNLQMRGTERIRELFRKYCLGIDYKPNDNTIGWKKYFLIIFGISAFIYRIFLYTSIILVVYYYFEKAIGIVLLMLEVYLLVVKPFLTETKMIMALKNKIKTRNYIISLSGAGILLLTLFMPLPWNIAIPCEVKPAVSNMVYARTDGFLEELCVKDRGGVKKGDVIFKQANPFIEWDLKEANLDKRIGAFELDFAQSNTATLGLTQMKLQALKNAEISLDELQHKKSLLTTASAINGIFAIYDLHLKPGKWLHKGEIIGEVYEPDKQIIAAFIRETDFKKISGNEKVSVSLEDGLESYRGRIVSTAPVPVILAPSPLINFFGGRIVCYPMPDGNTFQPVEPYYRVNIAVAEGESLPPGRTGTVWLRKYSSIGGNFLREVLSVLQKELYF